MAGRISLKRSLWLGLLLATLLAAGYTLFLDFRVRAGFEGRGFALPARIYARPLELHAGLRVPLAAVEQELRDLGYQDTPREGEAGWFTKSADGLAIAVRAVGVLGGGRAER